MQGILISHTKIIELKPCLIYLSFLIKPKIQENISVQPIAGINLLSPTVQLCYL